MQLYVRGERWKLRQEKRHKLQLFHAILCAIEEEMIHSHLARPTHIQHYSRLSYDKMKNHFIELEQKGMINRTNDGLVSITSKGRKFIKQYDELINLIESAGL
jgi:predicted transcriptional regulator